MTTKIQRQPLLKPINHHGKTIYIPNPQFTGRELRTPVDWSRVHPEDWATKAAPARAHITGSPVGGTAKPVQPQVTVNHPGTANVSAIEPPVKRRRVVGSKPLRQQKAFIPQRKGRV